MSDTAWRTIIDVALRPVRTYLFMNHVFLIYCHQIYNTLGHHNYRCFIEYLANHIENTIYSDDGKLEFPDHLIRTDKGKFHIENCIIKCMLYKWFEEKHMYTVHNGTYMTILESLSIPAQPYFNCV